MLIAQVIELDEVAEYLESHQLTERYLKTVSCLLSGNALATDLKKRKPMKDEIWQFRITKKYRAYCYFLKDTLIVFEINNHQ